MEEYEFLDWGVTAETPDDIRKQKSISYCYFHRWYPQLPEGLTFKSVIYPQLQLPEQLPFPRAMVRDERRSPKGADTWGAISTKFQVQELFATSLRCVGEPDGQYYCVREWCDDIQDEYRCFFNQTFKGVVSMKGLEPDIPAILAFFQTILPIIPYYRCVVDICRTSTGYLIIEFNSWEVNSGAYGLDWAKDSSLFYSEPSCDTILFKHGEEMIIHKWSQIPKQVEVKGLILPFEDMGKLGIKVLPPSKPSNWLIINDNLYVANEIWLFRFHVETLKPLGWHRGTKEGYRFCRLEACPNQTFNADKNYSLDLYKITPKHKHVIKTPVVDGYPETIWRYGFMGLYQDRYVFCRMMSNDTWCICEIS